MRGRTVAAIICFLAASAAGWAQTQPPVFFDNLDKFDKAAKGPWNNHKWSGDTTFNVSEQGHGGGRCLQVSSTGGEGAWITNVPVAPKSVYRLSGWIKTENITSEKGWGAAIGVQNIKDVSTPPKKGTNDWSEVSVTFDTGDLKQIFINCLLGGWAKASGKVWFDDIKLDKLSQENLVPSVRLHGETIGTPISKYVYGQFIEHLGRCIYGGIWAEMLDDRKFYYNVGVKESPWTPLGTGDGVVKMVKESAYVGEHTPVVALSDTPHGLAQGGLGLVAGKEYVGYAILAGAGTAEATLLWGTGEKDRQAVPIEGITAEFKKYPFKFTAGAATEDGHLALTGKGAGELKIGTVSLMPADNVDGMRADTLAVLKELNSPVYRWPGGNFVSGYDWHDGIGDRDKRPPRKNPAWKGVEHNDFGADEYMRFLKEVNAEAYVVLNSGLGTAESATEEVQYFVGADATPGGKKRVDNGHKDPYAVKFFGIGNEMYGDWQLGHIPLEDYVKKHNTYADAIRKEAPGVQIVGVGNTGPWSETMLKKAGDHMDLLSEHFYCKDKPELIMHTQQIADNIRAKVTAHKGYHEQLEELKGKHIPICMDEWNYWYGKHLYGELGTQYFLKDALGIAEGLNAYYRASDTVFMANYAQTVNVIGCVKTNKTAACLDTTGVVLALYRKQFGTLPIQVEGTAFPVDVEAAWTDAKDALTVSVINPTHENYDVAIGVEGIQALPNGGTKWTITGAEPMAKNVPGQQPGVAVKEEPVTGEVKSFPAPALSAVIYRVNAKPKP